MGEQEGPPGKDMPMGYPQRCCRAFPGQAEQMSQVRQFLACVLEGCPAADVVILLANEVATNAVQYGTGTGDGGRIMVWVNVRKGESVRIAVRDGLAPGRRIAPTARPSTATGCSWSTPRPRNGAWSGTPAAGPSGSAARGPPHDRGTGDDGPGSPAVVVNGRYRSHLGADIDGAAEKIAGCLRTGQPP
jgi:hypothetical protein